MLTPDAAIRVWGTPQLQALVQRWGLGLRKFHARLYIDRRLTGSDVGMAGLYTGFADLALMGRECTAFESKAFEWIFRYPPAHVQITTGSLDRPGQSAALIVWVHRDNPLSQLTLAQLGVLFGHDPLRGAQESIQTWGNLGLTGEWAGRLINLYADDAESGTGRFFRRAVLQDSCKMNWDRLTEFSVPDAGRAILGALGADRFGLAVTGGCSESVPQVKALALTPAAGDEAVAPTRETLISRRYPLARAVYAYFNRAPDAPADARVDAFLRYVLSSEGQHDIASGADYLPLSAETASEQLRKLG